ncbi:type I 3-dehydroquinate dehydratase [Methanonatronarchaeum sp. AMET-Sl]|uniref:type I 3-dehydroquinate dehydratase n=1 Tax=Methanonatronarchaeum sp. AMET-Sl TaxID=3037654 RepID=UPI00244DFD46|nr:type I 3-dehydroquinate dehydratase [Methanonatronarchaeum sp. AMET-Sl]WGI17990.1 type I 3-dehydroquinate dehydratase [Methanonatronarchaeum sp. AMET-Sl]
MRPTASKPVSTKNIEIGLEPIICGSIGEKNVEKALNYLNNQKTDLIELRIDKINQDSYRDLKRGLSEIRSGPSLIITNRREKEGGEYDGSESNRVEDLISFMGFADIIDIELHTPRDLRDKLIDKAREQGVPIIVSYHNHSLTPRTTEIAMKIEECMEIGDIAKVAYMAKTPLDVLSLMRATYTVKKELGKPLCSISMGDVGKHSRVIGPLYGSDIIYAPIGEETAPGQIPINKIKGLLRDIY